jgi:hypothetical protein
MNKQVSTEIIADQNWQIDPDGSRSLTHNDHAVQLVPFGSTVLGVQVFWTVSIDGRRIAGRERGYQLTHAARTAMEMAAEIPPDEHVP